MATLSKDLIARRLVPSAVIAASRVTLPARLAAGVRRRSGRRGQVELFFAFDDPCSAVAVVDLARRTAGRQVDLAMMPVVRRGMRADPAASLKREYAITDARRLAAHLGFALARSEPLDAQSTAFLAEWVASREQPGPALTSFCVRAMSELWFGSGAPVSREAMASIWRDEFGTLAPTVRRGAAVRFDEARMARRGPYETPAAWCSGRWFFAQDRPAALMAWLDELGWTASS